MKSLITIFSIIAVFLICSAANADTYVETFDNDNAGWKLMKQNFTFENAAYNSTGGNSGGYISKPLNDDTGSLICSFQPTEINPITGNPVAMWENMTVGQTLTADFKIDGTVTSPSDPMVRFYIGSSSNDYWMTKDAYSWNPNDDDEWTTHQVVLTEDNFVLMEGNASHNFEYALNNIADIGLQFGPSEGQQWVPGNMSLLGFAGTDTTVMLDNFGTVPEPATVCLLGFGALSIIRRKRNA